MGEAFDVLEGLAEKIFPKGYEYDYAAEARHYQQE